MQACGVGLGFDPLDLLLQDQLSVFQRFDFLRIGSGVDLFALNFTLESLVAALEFDQVHLYRHAAAPNKDRDRSDQSSVCHKLWRCRGVL